jgi:hypothetical protein
MMGENGTGMGVGFIDGTKAPLVLGIGAATGTGDGVCPAIGTGCAQIGELTKPMKVEAHTAKLARFVLEDDFNIK